MLWHPDDFEKIEMRHVRLFDVLVDALTPVPASTDYFTVTEVEWDMRSGVKNLYVTTDSPRYGVQRVAYHGTETSYLYKPSPLSDEAVLVAQRELELLTSA